MTELVSVVPVMSPALVDDLAGVAELVEAARAPRTIREYQRDWQRYAEWCASRSVDPVAARPEHVAAYVSHLVKLGRKESTISRAVSALVVTYDETGRSDDNPARHPGVKKALKGMRRKTGVARKQARAITTSELGRISSHLPNTLAGRRDRALLLVGFAAAMRRSEISALDIDDVTDTLTGLEVTIKRSKTDQEGAGHVIPVAPAADHACCPVLAWRAWLDASALTSGPAFRSVDRHGNMGDRLSARSVQRTLDRAATMAGVSKDKLSPHSLRAGYVTAAAQRGHREMDIKQISRHKSSVVLEGYVRRATRWQNPATDLGW